MGNDMEKNRQQGGQQQDKDRQGNQQSNTGQDRRPEDVSRKNPGQGGNQSDENADRDLEKRRAS